MRDIARMFHQFKVTIYKTITRQDYLRFLQYDAAGKVTSLTVAVHLFGAKSLPACATYGLADLYKLKSPSAYRFVQRNFSVDDASLVFLVRAKL